MAADAESGALEILRGASKIEANGSIGGTAINGSDVKTPGLGQRVKLNNRSCRKQTRELEGRLER